MADQNQTNSIKRDMFGRPVSERKLKEVGKSKASRLSNNRSSKSFTALLARYEIPNYVSMIPFSDEYFPQLVRKGFLTDKALSQLRSCAAATKVAVEPQPIKAVIGTDDPHCVRAAMMAVATDGNISDAQLNVERRFYDEFSQRTRPEFIKWFGKVLELYGPQKEINPSTDRKLREATNRVTLEFARMVNDAFERYRTHPVETSGFPTWFIMNGGGQLEPIGASKAYEMAKKNTNSGMCAGLDTQFSSGWGNKEVIRDYAIVNAERWVVGLTEAACSSKRLIRSQFIRNEFQADEETIDIHSVAAGMEDNSLWMLFARSKDENIDGSDDARPIVCPTAIDKVAGKMFTAPVIALMQSASRYGESCSTYAGFCGGDNMQEFLNKDGFVKFEHWAELDWKAFDRNCAQLLPYALTVMKSLFPAQYHKYLEDDLKWAMSATIITPEGAVTLNGGTMAMPSGWSKTSLYGTIASRIAIEYIRLSVEDSDQIGSVYCFGDDVLIGNNSGAEIDFIRWSKIAAEIGMVINTKKCHQSSGPNRFGGFLGYYHTPESISNKMRGWFPLMRMAPKFFWDERYAALPKQWRKFLTIKTLMKLEVLSGRSPESFRKICELVLDHYSDIMTPEHMPCAEHAMTEEEWEELRQGRVSRRVMTEGLWAWNSTLTVAEVMKDRFRDELSFEVEEEEEIQPTFPEEAIDDTDWVSDRWVAAEEQAIQSFRTRYREQEGSVNSIKQVTVETGLVEEPDTDRSIPETLIDVDPFASDDSGWAF